MSGSVRVEGASLRYSVTGAGTPLVLIHAGIADRRMWGPQIPALVRRYRVVTYDLRGFGESPMVGGPYTHYRDLRGLLDHLHVDRAILVGSSMGGGVAIDFALEHPERVRALILVDSALDGYRFTDEWVKERWRKSEAALEGGDTARAAAVEIETWVAGPKRNVEERDPALVSLVREMLLASYRASAMKGEEGGPDRPAIDRLAEIHVPTLVIVGEHDVPDMHKIADRLTAGIAGSERFVMPRTAHLPSLERPEEFNQRALDFLERAGSRTAR